MAPSYVIEDDPEASRERATPCSFCGGGPATQGFMLRSLSTNQAVSGFPLSSFYTDLSPVFCYGDRGLSDTPCRDARTLSARTPSLSSCPPRQGNVLDDSGSPCPLFQIPFICGPKSFMTCNKGLPGPLPAPRRKYYLTER